MLSVEVPVPVELQLGAFWDCAYLELTLPIQRACHIVRCFAFDFDLVYSTLVLECGCVF